MTAGRNGDRTERASEGRQVNRPGNRSGQKKEPTAMRTWALAGISGVLVALFALSVQWKDSQKITRVEVTGRVNFSEEAILARADVPVTGLLDTVSLSAIRDRLIEDPYVRDARVGRTFPGTVTIELEERIPVASFNLRGQVRYIDEEGVVLPDMKSEFPLDLPFVSGIPALQKSRVGRALESEEYFEAIDLLRAAVAADSTVYRLISEVDMNSGGDIIIHSVDVAVPIMFGRGEASRKFELLRAFWTKFVLDEGPEKLDYLDLRFNDQVVAKWNTKPRKTFNESSL